jgi:CHAT domain-containing protein
VLPLGLAFDGREASFVPSASTFLQIRADAPRRGGGVLALGDPQYAESGAAGYGRATPAPLPATRAEVEAVASAPEDRRLLGAAATETNLLTALPERERWSSVHLACHGESDLERPGFSSVALTADAQNDGYLTVAEALRLRLRADLAVLSACETGRARVVRGEGLLGLPSAFLIAGAPRVLVSLWKVDDDATQHLMRTFYREWRSGVPTARALRRAQESVRSEERWSHPRFWAAWALWGLAS